MTRTECRRQAGISLNHTSRLTRVPATLVKAYEDDVEAGLSTDELSRLARAYSGMATFLKSVGVQT